MRPFRLKPGLQRASIGGFALPLGFVPRDARAPVEGFTVEYAPADDEGPDAYTFHIVASHERLDALVERAFDLLPDEVYAIVEIGSRDAYRATDVYMTEDAVTIERFVDGWRRFRDFLHEDGSIAAGANSEEPFIEIFLDQWKGLWIHAPLMMRDDVESMFNELGLHEVHETWPGSDDESDSSLEVRSVLDVNDEFDPDVDELLLELRHCWNLELNVDPEANIDDAGRELGLTLWFVMVIVESVTDPEAWAYASIWATAASLNDLDDLIDEALEAHPQWRYVENYTVDRIAYDERPDELIDLPPRRMKPAVHLITFDAWPSDREPEQAPPQGWIRD
jgi:hypothetical protein